MLKLHVAKVDVVGENTNNGKKFLPLCAGKVYMMCHRTKHGMSPYQTWYATVPNMVCHRTKRGMPPYQTWFAIVPNVVCYRTKHGLPPNQTWFATKPNVVCYRTKHGMPAYQTWYTTVPNVVCYRTKHGLPPLSIACALACNRLKFYMLECYKALAMFPI